MLNQTWGRGAIQNTYERNRVRQEQRPKQVDEGHDIGLFEANRAFVLDERVVRVRLRGIPYERLPHSRSAVIKVRGKSILKGHRLRVLLPHDGDDEFLSN